MASSARTLHFPSARRKTELHWIPRISCRRLEMESSDLYASCRSIFTILCERAKHSNNPETESIIRTNLAAMQSDVTQEMLRTQEGQQRPFAGEIVSSHVPFDRRQTFRRIRGAGEPRRGPSNARGVRAPVVFDTGSAIP
jgi:hypothetical protein